MKDTTLFEISFEVCNKVGGIHTVLSSKAELTKSKCKEFFTVGPYLKEQAQKEFTFLKIPQELEPLIVNLKNKGITAHYGEWNIKGNPKTILIDYKDYLSNDLEYRKFYWDNYKIDSLNKGYDFVEPMIWSTACGIFIEEYQRLFSDKKVIVHCHEWLSGFAGLYLKQKKSPVGYIFTTHATILGRTYASQNDDLYSNIKNIDAMSKAYEFNIQEKHTTEVACANNSDIFTTVSPITALECENLLKRKPDILTINGLHEKKYPDFEEILIKNHLIKNKIKHFLSYFLGPYQKVDFDNNLLLFTSGRFEFKNKGLDVLISSLAKLNDKLKSIKESKTVYAFFLIPSWVSGIDSEVLENKHKLYELQHSIKNKMHKVEDAIIKHTINNEALEEQKEIKDMKEMIDKERNNFHKNKKSPISTHNINDIENNPIVKMLNEVGLDNKEDDKVQIVYAPFYLDGNDGLFNIHYDEFISGFDLGIFASNYEPFGYTPLEAVSYGVPCITTDLAGFGRHLNKLGKNNGGIVIDREGKSFEEISEKLFEKLFRFTKFTRKEILDTKYNAKQIPKEFDWEKLIENYEYAYDLALEKLDLY